jgi:hypothetical protein
MPQELATAEFGSVLLLITSNPASDADDLQLLPDPFLHHFCERLRKPIQRKVLITPLPFRDLERLRKWLVLLLSFSALKAPM